jgi:hypothetical protein
LLAATQLLEVLLLEALKPFDQTIALGVQSV